jgi:MFS family permease
MWLAFLCIAFGVVTIGSAFIHNFGEFVAVRVMLGIVEGGVIPGIVYVMTLFYRVRPISNYLLPLLR